MNHFDEEVIYAIKEGKQYYLNMAGNVIWEEDMSDSSSVYLNIDFMNRGYFYAASPIKNERDDWGGWGTSDNLF